MGDHLLTRALNDSSPSATTAAVAEDVLPLFCSDSDSLCDSVLYIMRSLAKNEHWQVRDKIAHFALPAAYAAGVSCNATLPVLGALENDTHYDVRISVAARSLPAACRADC